VGNKRYAEVMNIDVRYLDSTKEWQDLVNNCLTKRNDLVNDVLNGKYQRSKRYSAILKTFECSPLLDGDIALLEYMSKKPSVFTERMNNIKVEYSDIRQLTKDEVIIIAKISFLSNNVPRQNNYEIMFRNIDGKWMLSKYGFYN
jgi:hypothetical protein